MLEQYVILGENWNIISTCLATSYEEAEQHFELQGYEGDVYSESHYLNKLQLNLFESTL